MKIHRESKINGGKAYNVWGRLDDQHQPAQASNHWLCFHIFLTPHHNKPPMRFTTPPAQ